MTSEDLAATWLTCCTIRVSASSCVDRMSCLHISIPLWISNGTGSCPVTTSLWVVLLNKSGFDVISLQIKFTSYDLFDVTVRMTFCEGKRVVGFSVNILLAPLSRPVRVDSFVLLLSYLSKTRYTSDCFS